MLLCHGLSCMCGCSEESLPEDFPTNGDIDPENYKATFQQYAAAKASK